MGRPSATPPSAAGTLQATDAVVAAMDGAPACFGLVDRELRIIYQNAMFAGLVGGDAVGRAVSDLPALAGSPAEAAASAVSGSAVVDLEVAGPDGHMLINSFPVYGPTGAPIGASLSLRDVSSWVVDRQRVERLAQISGRLAAAATPAEVAAVTADAGVDALGASASAVMLRTSETPVLELISARGFPEEMLEHWRRVPIEHDVPISEAVRERAAVFLGSRSETTTRYPAVGEPAPGHNAWAAIPLVAHRAVLGALALSFRDAAAVAPAQRPGMLALASQCAQALERALLYNDISLANERLEAALDAGRMGWWEWDPEHDRVVWSPSLERIYGLEPGGFGGTYEDYLALVHPDDRDAVRERIERGLGGQGHEFEHRIVTPSGEVRWVDGRGRVLRRDGATRMGGLSMDVTDRKRNEQALRFLAEASDLLSQTLDYGRTLQQLAELVVDRLADWCAVTVVEDGRLVNVAVAHSDPTKVAHVRELQDRYPQDPDAPNGAPAVIRSGRTEYLPSIPDELLVAASPDPDFLQAVRDLGLRSVITAPLTARGRTFGAISMVLAESGSNYQPGDVELAEDLAHRAALAIDNARLYRERSEIADILQASLLPPLLPAIPGFDVAARYLPGGGGVRVGGDFYDVFPTHDGRWQIVIGDVCGKGAPAATLTGVARHTGRAAAIDDDSPLHLLRAINAALRRTDTAEDLRFCTAAIGLLEPGSPSRLTIARAGHPPPLLRRADGTVAELGAPGTLLGVYDDPELHPATAELASGDVLVLYTDGVPDSWWNAGGETRLAETIQALPGAASAAEVADRIEQAAVTVRQSGGDDIAILVLRAL